MNNKELQADLARRLSISQKEVVEYMSAFVEEYTSYFDVYDEAKVPFLKMGTMLVKKKDQRVIVNPITKMKMLVPPKLVLTFKPSQLLKSKLKDIQVQED